MSKPTLTFVHITDSHIGDSPDFMLHGKPTLAALQRIVDTINHMPQRPDFVLHTGDVSNDASPESYKSAAEVLSQLEVPLYFVAGNHDSTVFLREKLGAAPHISGRLDAPMDYQFRVGDELFVVLDAHSAAVRDPLGRVSDDQLAALKTMCVPEGPPLTVLLHYMPFRTSSPWLDENMILVNGDALHEALLPARDRLRGVFFGHLHRNCQISRDGIMYVCAPSTCLQYGWRAWDKEPRADSSSVPGYNLVQYFSDYVVVTSYNL